ncbi:MAG: phosphotyrosine protein phosphatase [Rhodomicrobium sp.]|nr:MAG: phosphotyrosine protein phosphatase [Rhodomicrobium sp.]
MKKISILFVCLGNICRSPIAEGVFRKKAEAANLNNSIEIDSAGTAAWHAGNPPDTRMIEAAKERGYDITNLRARQVNTNDFSKFDYILAMDDENLMDLEDVSPEGTAANLKLFLDYANGAKEREVPDPYFGGADGFFHVIELVESASDGLIKEILSENQS